MAERRTTRCCSAAALIAALIVAAPLQAATNGGAPTTFWPVRTIWTLALNNQLTEPPAFDESNAYFPIEGRRIAAYEIATGAQRWIAEADLASAPTAGGGLVFFMQGGSLAALHASDGSPAWTAPIAEPLAIAPAWASGWLIVATVDGSIHAIRAADGQTIWTRRLAAPACARPSIAGDRVYVPAANDRVIALQIETGAPIWERRLGGAPDEILAVDNRLFVGAKDNYFYAIVAADGTVDWRWRTGADAIGLPAVDEHRVYFVSLDNVVRALNRSNGVQQWIQMLALRPMAGPIKAGTTLVVYGLDPPLRAFNTADGKSVGDIAAPAPFAAPPQLIVGADGLPSIVVVTRDISKGATVSLVTRSADPAATPFAALPNPLTGVPTLPTP